MKIKSLLTLFVITLFLGSFGPVAAVHNEEFPTNGCTTVTDTLVVTLTATQEFVIDGKVNPSLTLTKGGCVDITVINNSAETDHDFTLIDESVAEDADFHEIWHMDTPPGNTTHHLWQLPNKDVQLEYFCEVEGHRDGGMEGKATIGSVDSDDGFLPGFNFMHAFLALLTIAAIPVLRRRN